MEVRALSQNQENKVDEEVIVKNETLPFIEANTKKVELEHLRNDCVIPVFSKDNETTIAHQEFIDVTHDAISDIFSGFRLSQPEIRTSHVVKGRTPSAIGKPAKELLEHEKTIYYERMAFCFQIDEITEEINGNLLNLTIGGVRAYNHENLYSKKTIEKFKFFIGFKNMVCCNMCVSSDGFAGDIKAGSTMELKRKLMEMMGSYEIQKHINAMKLFGQQYLTERQFALLIGRCRLYNHLPKRDKKDIEPILFNDSQINSVAKGFYEDEQFSREENGTLSLWNLYNLLTGANKTSYIDKFLDRSVNSHDLVQELSKSLENKTSLWYLN